MANPVRIATRNAILSARDKSDIESLASGLEEFFPRIVASGIFIEGPGPHHRNGEFRVRINVSVPTRLIVVDHRGPGPLRAALAPAFRAAGRRLEDHARRVRGDVKRRAVAARP